MKQDSNTREIGKSVFALVEYISHIMTLHPGDVIATVPVPIAEIGPVRIPHDIQLIPEDLDPSVRKIVDVEVNGIQ
ncbi:MAG: fumarylacetoacetate hydrolase family protein [Thermoplasmatota archaeon]